MTQLGTPIHGPTSEPNTPTSTVIDEFSYHKIQLNNLYNIDDKFPVFALINGYPL